MEHDLKQEQEEQVEQPFKADKQTELGITKKRLKEEVRAVLDLTKLRKALKDLLFVLDNIQGD